eukprot:8808_1
MASVTTRSKSKKKQTLQEKSQSLYDAVYHRKIEVARSYLEAGAKPDFQSPRDNLFFNSFHAALAKYHGGSGANLMEEKETSVHIDLLNMLLMYSEEKTETIFGQDAYGMNPFEWACADGKSKCTQWFIDLLHRAPWKDIADTIINRVLDLPSTLVGERCKRIRNQTPIQLATRSEDVDTVRVLCRNNVRPDVGHTNINGDNALHIAITAHTPRVLYELANIANLKDLQIQNNRNFDAQQLAIHQYQMAMTTAVTPKTLLATYQCKKIIESRLNHSLSDDWERIKRHPMPKCNAVMTFWKSGEEKNPNTNALKPAPIPMDEDTNNEIFADVMRMKTKTEQYRKISFEQACDAQHSCPSWITTYRGTLDVKERYVFKQMLSPFAKQFKMLRNQLNASMGNQIKHKSNHIKGALSPNVFEYKDQMIQVQAVNEELEKELTLQQRIEFYLFANGKRRIKSMKHVEIREILDPCHPCKRHNPDGPVFGLFATKDLPQKMIVGEYGGYMCTQDEYEAQIGHYERFDGQQYTFKFDTLTPEARDCEGSKFMINASYYSNELAFVNDGTKDSLFGKWSELNVSFFEIVINGWPHAFFRMFRDVKKGDELLTDYGNAFWRNYKNDMNTSKQLDRYYTHRRKRDRETSDEVNPKPFKRRKIDPMSSVQDKPPRVEMIQSIQQSLQQQQIGGEWNLDLARMNSQLMNALSKSELQRRELMQEIKRLKRENQKYKKEMKQCKRVRDLSIQAIRETQLKKKKYKDKCRLLLEQRNDTNNKPKDI